MKAANLPVLAADEQAAAEALLAELRSACEGSKLAACAAETSVFTAARYLRARCGNRRQALRMLLNYVKDRVESQPHAIRCQKCLSDPSSHNLRWVGFAKSGEPVAYTSFSQAHARFSPEANLHHTLSLLEGMVARFHAVGEPLGKWIIMIDFDGFSLRDNNPMSGKLVVGALQTSYAERLAMAVMYDAPRAFSGTWALINPVLDERTTKKVLFLPRRAEEGAAPWSAFATPELAEWLARETKDNRKRRAVPKRYWQQDAASDGHDARGTASWLADPHYVPTYGDALLAAGGGPELAEDSGAVPTASVPEDAPPTPADPAAAVPPAVAQRCHYSDTAVTHGLADTQTRVSQHVLVAPPAEDASRCTCS